MEDNHFSDKSGSSTNEHPEESFDADLSIQNERNRIKKLAPCYEIMRKMKWAAINNDDRDWEYNAKRGYEEAEIIGQTDLALAFKVAELTTDLDRQEKKEAFENLIDAYGYAFR